jgi:hypothetical protein
LDAVVGDGKYGEGRDEEGDEGEKSGRKGEVQGRGQRHFLATGHYARVVRPFARTPAEGAAEIQSEQHAEVDAALLRAIDGTKDQSYYLSAVTSGQLQKVSSSPYLPSR